MSSIIQHNQVFNNEVPFCRVYSIESKKQLEERLLAHRISYFIEWQDKSIFQRIFDRNGGKIVCTFRINKGDILKAKELCQGIDGIKFKDLGDIQTTERIRRRSEAARPQEVEMDVPSLRFENRINDLSLGMDDDSKEPAREQYEEQYSEQQYDEQQYNDQYSRQYAQQNSRYDQYEGYDEEGYEDGYYEEGYEEGYEDRSYGNQGYESQGYGTQGYEEGYEEEYYEEGYDEGYHDGYGNYGNYGNYDNYNG
ncbi:MAG: hypothetical protein K6E91_03495 [Butyrivibrio sp.]|nr:hypothetical protein [Butyrivibrio sp.]